MTIRSSRVKAASLLIAPIVSLALTIVALYEAQDAARSHRLTAERTLRDYATLAALTFSAHARERVLGQVTATIASGQQMAVDAHAACATATGAPIVPFSIHFIGARATVSPIAASPCATTAFVGWLRDTVAVHAAQIYQAGWNSADLVGAPPGSGGARWIVVYTRQVDAAGALAAASGAAMPLAAFLDPVFRTVIERTLLLPRTLVGNVSNDSLLTVVVTDGVGNLLFHSRASYASPFTGVNAASVLGGFRVAVTLRPGVANQLVIGGLPRSRLPDLLALFAIAATLTVVAILQLRRAAELARLRSDFVANVSHEIRTPLARLRLFADTLSLGRARTEAERARAARIVAQEALRLTYLTDNLLQFSRSERAPSGVFPRLWTRDATSSGSDHASAVAFDELLAETIDAFAPIAAARDNSVVLSAHARNVAVAVDASELRQAILNLLDNAVKYGPRGQRIDVVLSTKINTREGQPSSAVACLTVDDRGTGIPREERHKVWEPYYRATRERKSAIAGSGIGLAVVYDVVERAGGRAWISDAPSGGARIVIELPLLTSAPDVATTLVAAAGPGVA